MENAQRIRLTLKPSRKKIIRLDEISFYSKEEETYKELGIKPDIIRRHFYIIEDKEVFLEVDATNRDIISEIYHPLTSNGFSILKSEFYKEYDHKYRTN